MALAQASREIVQFFIGGDEELDQAQVFECFFLPCIASMEKACSVAHPVGQARGLCIHEAGGLLFPDVVRLLGKDGQPLADHVMQKTFGFIESFSDTGMAFFCTFFFGGSALCGSLRIKARGRFICRFFLGFLAPAF